MHRLDARSKILSLLLIIVAIFTASTFSGLLVLMFLVLLLLKLSRVPFNYLWRGLRPILVLLLLTLLMHLFFTSGGVVFWRWGPVTIEADGVYLGVFTALRLSILIFFTMLTTLTTTPLSLTGALEFLLKPLNYIRFPVSEMTMIIMISLRFIPTLMEESSRIVKAQMARGAKIGEGNIIQKARSLVPVVVPLFISAFRRAEELATAMEARCYQAGIKRTSLRVNRPTKADYAAVVCSSALAAAMILTPW